MTVRRFFDPAPEAGAAQGADPLAGLQTGDAVDLSTLGNVFGDEGSETSQDNEPGEGSEPAAQDAPAGGEPATGSPSGEPTAPVASDTPAGEPPAAPASPQAEGTENTDWQEVLLNQDRSSVLRALGYDEYDIQLLEHRRQHGNLNEYFRAASVDVDNIPAEELMRQDLKEKYPNLSEKAFEKLYQKEVVEKYNLSELSDEEDRELGAALLERDVTAIRTQRKEALKGLLDSGRPTQTEAQRLAGEQAAADEKAEYDRYVQSVENDPVTKALFQNKRLVLGDGAEVTATIPLEDTAHLSEAIRDTNVIFKSCVKADGTYDLNRFFSIVAYARNKEAVEKALFEAGKASAQRQEIDEHVNPAKISSAQGAAPQEESVGQAFATRGKSGTLGDLLDL